jgi:plasmid stabilization system protein ParE
MKRRLDVTPQARRDLVAVINWYRENVGARAALKVAQTMQLRLAAMESGRVRGAPLRTDSQFMRVVAKKHIIIFVASASLIQIVRIVHGSQDLDAIVDQLEADD